MGPVGNLLPKRSGVVWQLCENCCPQYRPWIQKCKSSFGQFLSCRYFRGFSH